MSYPRVSLAKANPVAWMSVSAVLTFGIPPCGPSIHAAEAEAAAPSKSIAVFDFELYDNSAGGGIIAQDENDMAFLKQATAQAKALLAATGRYSVVDTASVAGDVAAQQGVINCRGCEAALAQRLGADQAAIGVVTRVNRTEYALFVRVTDAKSGAVVASDFTGLRMGANYSWPRGVTSLFNNSILAKLLSH